MQLIQFTSTICAAIGLVFLFTNGISAQETTDSCRTPNNTLGRCVLITECTSLHGHLQTVNRPAEITNYIRNSQCGEVGRVPKLCCVMEFQATFHRTVSTCTTPDGQPGTCINILNCSNAFNLLNTGTNPAPKEVYTYLQQSRCDQGVSGKEIRICCPTSGTGGPISTSASGTSIPIGHSDLGSAEDVDRLDELLPESCGFQSLSDKLLGGETTGIDDYPWMALIEYLHESSGTLRFSCGGSLINERYILTAAHCLTQEFNAIIGTPYSVRLGEYDLSQDIDCIKQGRTAEDNCADPVVDIQIESYIVHPLHNMPLRYENDIGLIRLKERVTFTDFIKPICIPRTEVATGVGKVEYYVAGWGQTEDSVTSNIKLHLSIPFVDIDICAVAYKALRQNLNRNSQFCAGGQQGRDTCKGDSGGPLMMLRNQRWTAEGIVSFGPKPCALQGFAGVYTKVVAFLPWIGRHLQP